jgi:hypothetical protein
MITVETTDAGVRVTVPKGEVPPERLNAFLDWLRFESLATQSHLTETEADRLAEDVKSDWWAHNKHRFIPPGQP